MFSKIFKFFKVNALLPHVKQRFRIFLAKDLRQYRVEHHTLILFSIGRIWPFGIKNLNIRNIFYSLFFKFFSFFILFLYFLYLLYKFLLFWF